MTREKISQNSFVRFIVIAAVFAAALTAIFPSAAGASPLGRNVPDDDFSDPLPTSWFDWIGDLLAWFGLPGRAATQDHDGTALAAAW